MSREDVDLRDKSYQAVFRSQYLACAIIGQDGVVKKITRAMLERFSLSAHELKTIRFVECVHSDALADFMAEHICNKKEVSTRLIAIRGTKNMLLWNKVEMTTLHTENAIKEYMLVFQDCTESYQAQMILESALALSNDLFIFFDTKDCLLQCSEEAVRIFGYPNRIETLGMHYTTFFKDRISSAILAELFQAMREGKRFERDIPIRYKGIFEMYEVHAFNVMVKSIKAGTAVCFHKKSGADPVFCTDDVELYEHNLPSVFELKEEEKHQYETSSYTSLLEELKQNLTTYEYTGSIELINYLITIASKQEQVVLRQVKREVTAFRYENAVKIMEGYYK